MPHVAVGSLLGALGGVVVFLGGVWALLRGIFRQVNAVESNTKAVDKLTARLDEISEQVNVQAKKIARIEGSRSGVRGTGNPRPRRDRELRSDSERD